MEAKLDRLRERMGTWTDLVSAINVLEWDQHTHMPPGGAAQRAHQLATLNGLAHEAMIADETGALIEELQSADGRWTEDSLEGSLIRVAARRYRRASRIPAQLVKEIAQASSRGYAAWVEARGKSDFALFQPHLARLIELRREMARLLDEPGPLYDALLDGYEPGMRTADVQAMFDGMKSGLVDLVRAISERRDAVSDEPIHRHYDVEKQRAFGRWIAQRLGYDFKRGRQDDTVHPFCTTFSTGDVRITTRYVPDLVSAALFGTIHEAGHALYEQGVDPALERTGLAEGASLGIHESQSRLWENLVGRSRPFWRFAFPKLREAFPGTVDDQDPETFYRAVNRVEPSLIRVEADEVTYNLHVIVRFEIEQAVIAGDLAVGDLPAAWNDKYEAYLGIRPPDDARGVLQDVHWSDGSFGYFPTYSIGNVVSVQILNEARRTLPDLDAQVEAGRFDGLLGWLRQNVYRHGCKFLPQDLVKRVTGGPMDSRPYLAYLKEKYTDLYGL